MEQQETGNTQHVKAQPGFRKLVAWQKADRLASEVFRVSQAIPVSERWPAVQLLRAAVSVAANIAEGSGPGTAPEFIRFLEIAGRSLNEVEYYLHFLEDNAILPGKALTQAQALRADTGRLLFRLTESVRAKSRSNDGWRRGMIREDSPAYLADE